MTETTDTALERILGPRVRAGVSLAPFTTLRCGGPADFLVLPDTDQEVHELFAAARRLDLPIQVIGAGSNLLVSDRGIRGVTLATTGLNGYTIAGCGVRAQAGLRLATLANRLIRAGLSGLEFLTGIPGTVGGAVVMNAGLKEEWISRRVVSIETITRSGTARTIPAAEIAFGYRRSGLADLFVTAVHLLLDQAPPARIRETCAAFMRRRRVSQPLEWPSAGSVFQNPPGDFAGRLIEECGLKNRSIGGAQVSERHANFIINRGRASAADVYHLMRLVQDSVRERYNVLLKPEIQLLGEFP